MFWLMANSAMRASIITLPHHTEIKILGGFTGTPTTWKEHRPKMTVSYDVTVKDESIEQKCKDLWNSLHARLPSWASSKIKAFPRPKRETYGSMKPQVIALAASQPMDFAEWSITVKDDSGQNVPVFSSTPSSKSPKAPLPVRLLQGEYPSDSKSLTLRFEFRGIKPKGPYGTPISEFTIENPFYRHRSVLSSHASSKGLVGTQRITAEHFRLDAPRTELLQEVTFRLRCDPWHDADDGVQVWNTTICNAAGGWDVMPLVKVKRIPAEQAQEIVCRTAGWPSRYPLRVRFWLSPRFSHSRPPRTSFEFKQVVVPKPGLGQAQNMTARSGNAEATLFSVQNRSEGVVSFRLADLRITPRHECTSWHLRDSQGNTTHPGTGAEYRAWEVDDEGLTSNRVTFDTNLPTNTEWFEIGLTEVVPEMVELEFPPQTKP